MSSSNTDATNTFPTPTVPPVALESKKTRIGWIGTGVMGASMAGHIQSKLGSQYELIVYNRTESKTASLAAAGAKVAKTIEEVAQNADIIFTIVAFPSDVRSTYLGGSSGKGVLDILRPGSIVIDMTTSEPGLAREIATAAAERNIYSLDAPVSGGDLGARNGTLSIMVGGAAQAAETVRPLFEAMGKNITLCGAPGAGQHTKMVNQILIASGMIGVCEGLLYAQKAGLDPLTTISAVQAGAAGSWSITNLGPKIVKRDFAPGFYVEHFIKDLGIAIREANQMGLALPGLALAQQLYVATQALGAGREATTALILAIEAVNGIKPKEQK